MRGRKPKPTYLNCSTAILASARSTSRSQNRRPRYRHRPQNSVRGREARMATGRTAPSSAWDAVRDRSCSACGLLPGLRRWLKAERAIATWPSATSSPPG